MDRVQELLHPVLDGNGAMPRGHGHSPAAFRGHGAQGPEDALVHDRNLYISTNQCLQHLINNRYTVF